MQPEWGGVLSLNRSGPPLTAKPPRCQENQAAEKIQSLSSGESVGGRGANPNNSDQRDENRVKHNH